MRFRTRAVAFAIPALLIAAFAFFTLFGPEPGEEIEYLRREDAVIVQMRTAGGWSSFDLTAPEFTLYGDGTLIYTRDGADGDELLEARLPPDAIEELLEYLKDTGFFEFGWEQPEMDVFDAPTTYLYAQTKADDPDQERPAANAVSAYALGLPIEGREELAGNEYGELRRIAEIRKRLRELDPEATGGESVGPYAADAVLLSVSPAPPPDMVGRPASWPVPEVDLSEIAPDGSQGATRIVEGEAARAIMERFEDTSEGAKLRLFHSGRFYDVGWRPALPFEEHFPEFDQPQ
jgi:hypothetical protein